MTHGVIQVYFGNGKGKTSAASGLLLRALHYKNRIFIAQFLKTGKWQSGETIFFKKHRLCTVVQSQYTHPGFYKKERPSEEELISDQTRLLNLCSGALGEKYDILFLDEVLDSFSAGFIGRQDLTAFLDRKPPEMEIILTGRKCPDFVKQRAGLVTEFREIKHPFNNGVLARKGIEY